MLVEGQQNRLPQAQLREIKRPAAIRRRLIVFFPFFQRRQSNAKRRDNFIARHRRSELLRRKNSEGAFNSQGKSFYSKPQILSTERKSSPSLTHGRPPKELWLKQKRILRLHFLLSALRKPPIYCGNKSARSLKPMINRLSAFTLQKSGWGHPEAPVSRPRGQRSGQEWVYSPAEEPPPDFRRLALILARTVNRKDYDVLAARLTILEKELQSLRQICLGRGIERTPGVCGGSARITRTRIPVWILESLRRQGASEAEILAAYPTITASDLVSAWSYVFLNQQEIEAELLANDAL